jgi:hypothetical protein
MVNKNQNLAKLSVNAFAEGSWGNATGNNAGNVNVSNDFAATTANGSEEWGNLAVANSPPAPRTNAPNATTTLRNLEEALLESNVRCKQEYEGFEVPDENIYFYLGHGSSLTGGYRRLKIERVPEDCIYITQTVCGVVNFMRDEIFQAFANPKNVHIWRDPVNHLDEINALFGDLPGVHIHYPNCTFVNTSFYPCSANGEDGLDRIEYSGLVPLDIAHTISFKETPREFKTYSDDKFKEGEVHGVPEVIVRKMYEYAVYPEINIVKGTEGRFLPATDSLNVISQNGVVPFSSLKQAADHLSARYSILDIMHSFPGIHFNFLCRSLKVGRDANRRREMTMRRRHSAVLQDTALNTIGKLAYTGFNYGAKKGEMSQDGDVLEFIYSLEDRIRAEENLKKFYDTLAELRDTGYKRSFAYLEPIFVKKYLDKFYSLMQQQKSLEEIKAFIDILRPDIAFINQPIYALESSLLDRMATYAFAIGNRGVARHLCRKGAPIRGMQAEYNEIKRFFTQETLRQRRGILKNCRRAFGKAKTRRNSNNNNSRFGHSNNNRSRN